MRNLTAKLALLSVWLALPVLAQTPVLPNHVLLLGATCNPNDHPACGAEFGVGQQVADKTYATNVVEFTPSIKGTGTLTADRMGLQQFVWLSTTGNTGLFLTADAGVATASANVSGSYSGGGGFIQRISVIKSAQMYFFVHVRFVDSPIAVNRKAIVGSLGFAWGGK